jgi:hypothetical protein
MLPGARFLDGLDMYWRRYIEEGRRCGSLLLGKFSALTAYGR